MLWFGLAVMLFWAVGAYNRLVRLRSQGLGAFAMLDSQFGQLVAMTAQSVGRSEALVAASEQFLASLKVSRSQPFNGETTKALKAAYETLCLCWLQLPDAPPPQWDQLVVQIELARSDFNKSVLNYNAAIRQFPALLLAWIFGFKPAQSV